MYKDFEDKEFEKLVDIKYKNNTREIFPIEYKGKKYWLKKGRKTSSNLFHHLMYKVLPFEFLIPVENKTESQAVEYESNKLIRLKEQGINVPEVIASNEKFFVMGDCGEQVYVYLKSKRIQNKISKEEATKILTDYIVQLANIHNKGFFHGGAQCRNFTLNEDKVFAIDLEDSFDKNVELKVLQFRDLLLLLISITKIGKIDLSYKEIIELYISNTNNNDFIKKLKNLVKKLDVLLKIYSMSWIQKILPRDAHEFCTLLKELKKI